MQKVQNGMFYKREMYSKQIMIQKVIHDKARKHARERTHTHTHTHTHARAHSDVH